MPPHSDEVERSIIGCVLIHSESTIPVLLEKFGSDEGVFYNLKHETIWNSIKYLHAQGTPVDLITLQQELKNRDMLDQVGGIPYLSESQDFVPSAANITYYLNIAWDMYVARRTIQQSIETARQLMETKGEMTESFVAVMEKRHENFQKLLNRGLAIPKYLCAPSDFGEEFFARWFSPKKDDDYGFELPFKFPLRLRPHEMTLMTGDNGSGKSSMLGMMGIVCAKAFEKGERVVVASMEVQPAITLWIMARQLLGTGKLEDTQECRQRAMDALAWLNKHVLIYNFMGITDWRELLNTFRYAREHKQGEIFIVDSVMRIGIQDDDYATQGLAAAQFADFSVKTGAHTLLVVHENKGDARGKDRIRGSKQWSDNAHNVVGMVRNESKAQKIEELNQELEAEAMSEAEHREKVEKFRGLWDSKFLLHKQRWPGSQQNGSKWLWFHKDSLQFHDTPNHPPYNFLLK